MKKISFAVLIICFLFLASGCELKKEDSASEVTCQTIADCGGGEYCYKEPGSCASEGVCKERSQVCSEVYEPVCGCDGKTYANECHARGAGVSVDSVGVCGTNVQCSGNADCKDGEYCHVNSCGDTSGVCQVKPELCSSQYLPACGCDGKTYTNICSALSNGISVASENVCAVPAACSKNADCGTAEVCLIEGCDVEQGSCKVTWDIGTIESVCGCDGYTYSYLTDALYNDIKIDKTGESCN